MPDRYLDKAISDLQAFVTPREAQIAEVQAQRAAVVGDLEEQLHALESYSERLREAQSAHAVTAQECRDKIEAERGFHREWLANLSADVVARCSEIMASAEAECEFIMSSALKKVDEVRLQSTESGVDRLRSVDATCERLAREAEVADNLSREAMVRHESTEKMIDARRSRIAEVASEQDRRLAVLAGAKYRDTKKRLGELLERRQRNQRIEAERAAKIEAERERNAAERAQRTRKMDAVHKKAVLDYVFDSRRFAVEEAAITAIAQRRKLADAAGAKDEGPKK